jgi:hypothetical protein
MEGTEHHLNLSIHFLQRGWRTKSEKENGIAFNLGDLKAQPVDIDQAFQEFLYNEPTVFDFRPCYETGKTADVGDEKQAFVFHSPKAKGKNHWVNWEGTD